jgi:hypothetical protein
LDKAELEFEAIIEKGGAAEPWWGTIVLSILSCEISARAH